MLKKRKKQKRESVFIPIATPGDSNDKSLARGEPLVQTQACATQISYSQTLDTQPCDNKNPASHTHISQNGNRIKHKSAKSQQRDPGTHIKRQRISLGNYRNMC